MQNEFAIELPQLDDAFDPNLLWQNCKDNENHINESYGVQCWEVPATQKEVKHIFDKINQNILSKPLIGWYMHKFKNQWLKPHVDNGRDAILMFPIDPKQYKISFLDSDDKIVYEHEYKCPTIVNSDVMHCVYDEGIERKFFQISLSFKDHSWNKGINYVNNGQLLHQTVQ